MIPVFLPSLGGAGVWVWGLPLALGGLLVWLPLVLLRRLGVSVVVAGSGGPGQGVSQHGRQCPSSWVIGLRVTRHPSHAQARSFIIMSIFGE